MVALKRMLAASSNRRMPRRNCARVGHGVVCVLLRGVGVRLRQTRPNIRTSYTRHIVLLLLLLLLLQGFHPLHTRHLGYVGDSSRCGRVSSRLPRICFPRKRVRRTR